MPDYNFEVLLEKLPTLKTGFELRNHLNKITAGRSKTRPKKDIPDKTKENPNSVKPKDEEWEDSLTTEEFLKEIRGEMSEGA